MVLRALRQVDKPEVRRILRQTQILNVLEFQQRRIVGQHIHHLVMFIHRRRSQHRVILTVIAFQIIKLEIRIEQITKCTGFVGVEVLGEVVNEVALDRWGAFVDLALELAEVILVLDCHILSEHKRQIVVAEDVGVGGGVGQGVLEDRVLAEG